MINEILAHKLVTTQFPKWKDLKIEAVSQNGWDNRTFRLGNHMLVRMPSAQQYEAIGDPACDLAIAWTL